MTQQCTFCGKELRFESGRFSCPDSNCDREKRVRDGDPISPVKLRDVSLRGTGGNVFYVIGALRDEMRRSGFRELGLQFEVEALAQQSYDDVLATAKRYMRVRFKHKGQP